jgi:hypothetical protein
MHHIIQRDMRHARRLIVTLIGVAIWCVAAAAGAYAVLPDPDTGGSSPPPPPPVPPVAPDTPLWKFVVVAAVATALTMAIMRLVSSLRHTRAATALGVPQS